MVDRYSLRRDAPIDRIADQRLPIGNADESPFLDRRIDQVAALTLNQVVDAVRTVVERRGFEPHVGGIRVATPPGPQGGAELVCAWGRPGGSAYVAIFDDSRVRFTFRREHAPWLEWNSVASLHCNYVGGLADVRAEVTRLVDTHDNEAGARGGDFLR